MSTTELPPQPTELPPRRLLVDCNQLAVDIDNEIVVVYNFIRDRYKTKFPELESLVHSPLEYARVVQVRWVQWQAEKGGWLLLKKAAGSARRACSPCCLCPSPPSPLSPTNQPTNQPTKPPNQPTNNQLRSAACLHYTVPLLAPAGHWQRDGCDRG